MSIPNLETRCADLGPVELRESPSGGRVLAGYAAVFNRYSQNLGGFVEQVDPAAFNKSLADAVPVMCRLNHADAALLGATWAGTLRLSVDGTGLLYEVDLPGTSAGNDVHTLAQRGDLKWSSFAFVTIEDEWSETDQGFPLRTLRAVKLIDVAPVNSPAYLDTTVAARSLERARATQDSSPQGEAARPDPAAAAPHPSVALRRRLLELDALR